MSATPNDEQSLRILEAIGRRCRPYTDRDIARATRLSQRVVQRRLRLLLGCGPRRAASAGANGANIGSSPPSLHHTAEVKIGSCAMNEYTGRIFPPEMGKNPAWGQATPGILEVPSSAGF